MIEEFIAYLKEQVRNHSIYVWGAQGQKEPTVCEKWIRKREAKTGGTKINGKYMTYADIAVDRWKAEREKYGSVLRAFDCSGLGVFFLLNHKLIKSDLSAHGLMCLCKETHERRAGYWVFHINSKGRATHIGYLIDENTVIEAKGRAYGVVETRYKASAWDFIGIPSVFDFSPDTDKKIKVKGSVRVREGNGVKYKAIGVARNCYLPYLGQAEEAPYWYKTQFKGVDGYISSKERLTEIV